MKEFITRKKTYKIDERGIVYQEDGVTVTKDISIKNGYYYLCSKPIHKIVYELYKGPIPRKMVCHHKNICSRDNRPSNLVLLTKQEHIQIHKDINSNDQLKRELKSKAVQFFYREYKTVYKTPLTIHRKQSKKYYEKHKEELKKQTNDYYHAHQEEYREYYQENKEELNKKSRERRTNNLEEYKRRQKEYRDTHKEEAKKRSKQYYQEHKEEKKEYNKQYYQRHKEK